MKTAVTECFLVHLQVCPTFLLQWLQCLQCPPFLLHFKCNLTGYDDIVCRFSLCTFNLIDQVVNFSWLFLWI